MLHGEVRSPHLRALLQFEAEKLGLPVRFQESVLSEFRPPPFRREPLILCHAEYHRERFGIRLSEEEVLVNIPACIVEAGDPIGYLDHGQLVPLGAVVRNVLLVFFSLEALAEPGAVLARRPRDGHAGSVLNAVFDLVVSQAMPKLQANIEGYDWLTERRRFGESRTRSVQARIGQLRQNLMINDRSIEEKTWELEPCSRTSPRWRRPARHSTRACPSSSAT